MNNKLTIKIYDTADGKTATSVFSTDYPADMTSKDKMSLLERLAGHCMHQALMHYAPETDTERANAQN